MAPGSRSAPAIPDHRPSTPPPPSRLQQAPASGPLRIPAPSSPQCLPAPRTGAQDIPALTAATAWVALWHQAPASPGDPRLPIGPNTSGWRQRPQALGSLQHQPRPGLQAQAHPWARLSPLQAPRLPKRQVSPVTPASSLAPRARVRSLPQFQTGQGRLNIRGNREAPG